jgi:predicted RNA-binding protein
VECESILKYAGEVVLEEVPQVASILFSVQDSADMFDVFGVSELGD